MEGRKNVNGRGLRRGYTTGTCAAAAAKAAASLLLGGERTETVTLDTPKEVRLTLPVRDLVLDGMSARCGVEKDGGDDPDVTHGLVICAEVSRRPSGIHIHGGEGIGRVTRPGLDQPVGEAAINSVPRKMIVGVVEEVCLEYGYTGGLDVTISAPGGEALAKRTFNPRLGIEGGISILGTTGIVEPMSHRALADTVCLEIRQLAARGEKSILLTPGNYGETFAAQRLGLRLDCHVNCSNFLGEALDTCAEHGFQNILLVGHIGKLVKVGIGLMNTHSSFGDGRMETLLACALEAGAQVDLLMSILGVPTTDGGLLLLREAGLLEGTMDILGKRIQSALVRRVPEDVKVGFVCFTNHEELSGVLCRSGNAETLMELWRKRV